MDDHSRKGTWVTIATGSGDNQKKSDEPYTLKGEV